MEHMKTVLFLVLVAAALWWGWNNHQEKEKARVQAEAALVAEKAESERAQQSAEAAKKVDPVAASRLGIKETGNLEMQRNVKKSGNGPAVPTPAPGSALDRKAYR